MRHYFNVKDGTTTLDEDGLSAVQEEALKTCTDLLKGVLRALDALGVGSAEGRWQYSSHPDFQRAA